MLEIIVSASNPLGWTFIGVSAAYGLYKGYKKFRKKKK